MKNIRKFETTADMEAAALEECSVSYVNEGNKVYATHENGGQGGDTVKNYMRFVAVEDSQINLTSVNKTTSEADNSVDLKHSKDGVIWAQYDFNPIPLAAGETLYLKGNNENGLSVGNPGRICTFGDLSEIDIQNTPSTGKFKCHGNIMSLLYGDDFEDKTTIPNEYCYRYMFLCCNSLTTAPELPATTLAKTCYAYMFSGCTNLTTAPELPATTLAESCYSGMFRGCKKLTTAPELPATTLADTCYVNMFDSCSGLTTAPELPATTLAWSCYKSMFSGCENLTTAPVLPATKLTKYCYQHMFHYCTSLATAPELPATTLAEGCYTNMFYNCESLTTAPSILPATTLDYSCYNSMFEHCGSLTTAPVLPATTLTDYCYEDMFRYCKSLNHITILATDFSGKKSLFNWIEGISSTGTFVKHPDLDSSSIGVPEGWTVEDAVL